MPKTDWTRTASLPSTHEAVGACQRLRAHDIPAEVLNMGQGGYAGIGGAAAVEVWVPRERLADALRVLSEAPEVVEGPDVTCASCGETSDPGFAVCWSCGRDLAGLAEAGPPEPDEERPASRSEAPAEASDDAPEEEPTAEDAPTSALRLHPMPPAPPTRRVYRQLGLLLLIAIVPSAISSRLENAWDPISNGALEAIFALHDLIILTLIYFMVRRDARPRATVGLARISWWVEIAAAVPIAVLVFVVDMQSMQIAASLGLEFSEAADSLPEPGLLFRILFVPALLLSAFTEEIVFRAFLWNRLRQGGVPPLTAVLIAAALFTATHGYASAGMLQVFLVGLLWAAIYWFSGKLPRLVLAHFATNVAIYYG